MSDPLDPAVRTQLRRVLLEVRHGCDLLRAFHAVGEYGSYTAAAKALDLAGATSVRRQVDRLRAELGVALIAESDNSGVSLTPAGRAVWEWVHALFGAQA